MIDRAVELREVGVTPTKISEKMGVNAYTVRGLLSRMGVSPKRVPNRDKSDVDKAQQMHELARYRLTIDEAAEVMGITITEAFSLASWYEVRFDGSPIDTALMLQLAQAKYTADQIAKVMGFSRQKVAAILKAKREMGA